MPEDIEVSIEITKFCPFECPWCSTDASVEGEHLPMERIEEFFDSVLEGNRFHISRINVTGGEPLFHPAIGGIMMMCYQLTPNVWIYTNLVRNMIFNSRVVKEVGEIHANVCIAPGTDIHIPERKVDMIHLLKLIRQGRAENWVEIPIKASANIERSEHDCETCKHIYLQSDGKVVAAPCKKEW